MDAYMINTTAENCNGLQFCEEEMPAKNVEEYPLELDLWLEEHMTDLEQSPVGRQERISNKLGHYVSNHQDYQGRSVLATQLVTGHGLISNQSNNNGLVISNAPVLVQQSSQNVLHNSHFHHGNLVANLPQQPLPIQHVQPLPELVPNDNHTSHDQSYATQTGNIMRSNQDHMQFNMNNLDEEGMKLKTTAIPTEGKVVIYTEMPEVPNATKDSDGKYPCGQCEYKATRQWNLKKHKLSVHEGIKYSCDECDYKATDQSQVKKHKKVKH